MKNQTFQALSESDIRRKLDVTLRQMTGDRLTEEQRQVIGVAADCRRQYSFHVCKSLGTFCQVVNPKNACDGKTVIKMLFGDLEDLAGGSAAALVYHIAPSTATRTIYIYLPKEEKRDEH